MKLVLSLTVLLSFATPSFAAPAKCAHTAEKTVLKKFANYFYQAGRRVRSIEGSSCKTLRGQKGTRYIKCGVFASTGDGAGDVSFEVLLTEKCDRSFAAYITGQE
jgi:hypothetical protein